MEKETCQAKECQSKEYCLIFTIINRGFSETVMDAAREKGAFGGTIIHGKGSGANSKLFHNIALEEEKEAVLIIAEKNAKNQIMDGIMRSAGLNTEAQGITFTLPVDDFFMLKPHKEKEEKQQAVKEKE